MIIVANVANRIARQILEPDCRYDRFHRQLFCRKQMPHLS
jgi:hypothetical protein